MDFITVRQLIRSAAERYKESVERYTGTRPDLHVWTKRQRRAYGRLQALDPETATAADVERALGAEKAHAPVSLTCDNCYGDAPGVAAFEFDVDDSGEFGCSIYLCAGCLRASADALDELLAAERVTEEADKS